MNQVIRAAVIGTGSMGRHHVRVYHELKGVDLIGLHDADAALGRRMASVYGCRSYDTIEALLDARPDVVSIAIPTSRHADTAIQAMQAGVHVLVEKPIAGSLRDASRMLDAALAAGRMLTVGHIERYNPAVRALAEAVHPDDILALNVMRVGPRPPRIKDAGVIVDLAVHDIDLAFHLTGRGADDVFCVTSGQAHEHEDTASILMRLHGGVAVQLTANWITPYKSREIQLITEDRVLRADLIAKTVHAFSRPDDGPTYTMEEIPVRDDEPLRAELAAFVEAVRDGLPAPIPARDGIRALEVAVRATAYKHIRLQKAA